MSSTDTIRSLGALAVVIVLAGCGSSTKTTASTPATTTTTGVTTTTAAPTKAEFIAKADAVCKREQANTATADEVKAAQTAAQANGSAANVARLATAMRAHAKHLSTVQSELRALEPPPADRAVISKYLDTAGKSITLFESAAAAVDGHNFTHLNTLVTEIDASVAKAKGLAQGYGFKVCGSAA